MFRFDIDWKFFTYTLLWLRAFCFVLYNGVLSFYFFEHRVIGLYSSLGFNLKWLKKDFKKISCPKQSNIFWCILANNPKINQMRPSNEHCDTWRERVLSLTHLLSVSCFYTIRFLEVFKGHRNETLRTIG